MWKVHFGWSNYSREQCQRPLSEEGTDPTIVLTCQLTVVPNISKHANFLSTKSQSCTCFFPDSLAHSFPIKYLAPCPNLNPSLFKANFYFHFLQILSSVSALFIHINRVYWLQHCLLHLIIQNLEIQPSIFVCIFPSRIWLDVYTNKKGCAWQGINYFLTLLPLYISATDRIVKLASSQVETC